MTRIPFENVPPKLMRCMMDTEAYINDLSLIDTAFMELIKYRVSSINHCAYCMEMHFKEAIAAGESDLRIYSSTVWRETNFYSETEQALLIWAESVTTLHDTPQERQLAYNQLNKYFKQEDVANITLSIVQINAWNRLVKSFGFEAGNYQVGQH